MLDIKNATDLQLVNTIVKILTEKKNSLEFIETIKNIINIFDSEEKVAELKEDTKHFDKYKTQVVDRKLSPQDFLDNLYSKISLADQKEYRKTLYNIKNKSNATEISFDSAQKIADALNNKEDISLNDIPEFSEEEKRRQELLALKADLEKAVSTKVKTVDTGLHDHFIKIKREQEKASIRFGCKDIEQQRIEQRKVDEEEDKKIDALIDDRYLSAQDLDEALPMMQELEQVVLKEREENPEISLKKYAPKTVEEYFDRVLESKNRTEEVLVNRKKNPIIFKSERIIKETKDIKPALATSDDEVSDIKVRESDGSLKETLENYYLSNEEGSVIDLLANKNEN